jgi:hypothetical protein
LRGVAGWHTLCCRQICSLSVASFTCIIFMDLHSTRLALAQTWAKGGKKI